MRIPTDLFLNKDPGMLASVITPFSTFKGTVIDIQSGIYDQGIKTEGNYTAMYNTSTHAIAANGTLHVGGMSGPSGNEVTQTGFNMKKYLDPNLAHGAGSQFRNNRFHPTLDDDALC